MMMVMKMMVMMMPKQVSHENGKAHIFGWYPSDLAMMYLG
jgi:hypothetical protein